MIKTGRNTQSSKGVEKPFYMVLKSGKALLRR